MFLFLTSIVISQDLNFSEPNLSPLSLNPGLTGAYNGNFRVGMAYRDQWRTTINPYKTALIYGDVKMFTNSWGWLIDKKKSKNNKKTYLAVGGSYMYQREGEAGLNIHNGSLSFAYFNRLIPNNIFSLGGQYAFKIASVDYSKLTWNSQYDGNSNNLLTAPILNNKMDNLYYTVNNDYSVGALWRIFPSKYFSSNLGISYFHFVKPDVSGYIEKTETIKPRYTIHWNSTIHPRGSQYRISPLFVYSKQDKTIQNIVGLSLKRVASEYTKGIGTKDGNSISIGTYYKYPDGIILSSHYTAKNIDYGFNYDLNIGNFKSANRMAFEFSVIYIMPSLKNSFL